MIRALLFVLMTSNLGFAQQWVTYEMSYGLEVDFPKEPTIVDTTSRFKLAFLDSAGTRFMVSQEPFSNYRYPHKINNREDLVAFYSHLINLIMKLNPGSTLRDSTMTYKDDLLLLHVDYEMEGPPLNSCAVRVLLTDGRVYFIQACGSDTTMLDAQRRFLVSLNVTGGHPFISQLEPETADERAENLERYRQKGIVYGYVLRYITVGALLGWLSLLIILIIKTRRVEPHLMLKIAFSVFRWASVGILAIGSLTLLIGLASQPAGISIKTCAILGSLVLLTVVIAFVRTPSTNKPTV